MLGYINETGHTIKYNTCIKYYKNLNYKAVDSCIRGNTYG